MLTRRLKTQIKRRKVSERSHIGGRKRNKTLSADPAYEQTFASGRQISYGVLRYRPVAPGGITDILLVISKQSAGQYTDFLGSGAEFGVSLTYKIQEAAGGIAEALELAEGFILPGERFIVLLGDNLFMDDLTPYVQSYLQQPEGTAKVLLKPVEDARRYGVPVFDGEDSTLIAYIEEKPEIPKTNYCVTGIYMYDEAVFDIIRRVSPSQRGSWKLPM